MKRLLAVFLSLLCFFSVARSQQAGCAVRITLLTCAPGDELYSSFGHTALRVEDSAAGSDLVYNYGSFEFGPDFYTEFIRGRLLYFVSVESYYQFLYQYRVESRSVQEQELQLDCEEKQKLLQALRVNALEQNKYYRYDFLFDNCTTRAKDIVKGNTFASVLFKNILPADRPSFRDLIHQYLDAGHKHWSKFGIDILLGAKLDRKVTNEEAMFLPDYLLKGFDSASVGGRPLVTPPRTTLAATSPLQQNSWFTPFVLFFLLFLFAFLLESIKTRPAQIALKVFDSLFFITLGLAGFLLLFMWFGTDHKLCSNNYNLLWALPTHLVAAFFVMSRKNWVRAYFKAVFVLSLLLTLAWFILPQDLNSGLIPVMMIVVRRSWKLSKPLGHDTKKI